MVGSVDTISLVQELRSHPSDQYFSDYGFRDRNGKFGTSWVNNGRRDSYEPRLTFYLDFRGRNMLKAIFSIPRFSFGTNLLFPDNEQIIETMKAVSDNISNRVGFGFNALTAFVHRIDYSYNLFFEPEDVARVIRCYSRYKLPYLERDNRYLDETVYFLNQLKAIRLYDKQKQILSIYPNLSEDVLAASSGLIRLEYYFLKRAGVKHLAKRLKFADTTANTMLLERNIQMVTNDLRKIVNIEMIDLSNRNNFSKIHSKTNNLKKAIHLSGFIDAFNEYGEDFYLNPEFDYSKSTYKRGISELQSLGIPF